MLLHRLFENRLQVAEASVTQLIEPHVKECYRLLDVPSSEQERKTRDFTECWPFSPYLLQLLEDQVLVATDAQETRDLIRILANLYKAQGEPSLRRLIFGWTTMPPALQPSWTPWPTSIIRPSVT
jgi:hypothetical protein